MDSLEAVGGFVALLGGAVGVAAGYARFSVRGRTVHAARRARRESIADARRGIPARIVGRVRLLDRHLVAPLTGRRCCYYHARAVSVNAGASGYSDLPGESRTPEENGCDFAVDDGTGSVLVRVEVKPNFLPRRTSAVIWPRLKSNASILWGELPVWTGTTPWDEEAFRITPAERSEWRLSEWALGDGDVVCVFGVLSGDSTQRAPSGSVYREKPGPCVLRPPLGLNLLLSDHPDMTGRIDT